MPEKHSHTFKEPADCVLMVNETWAITTDCIQWILMHYRPPKWRAVAFAQRDKAVLIREMRRNGIKLSPELLDALDRLPGSPEAWCAKHGKLGQTSPGSQASKSSNSAQCCALAKGQASADRPYRVRVVGVGEEVTPPQENHQASDGRRRTSNA